jgi:hypothetical protein
MSPGWERLGAAIVAERSRRWRTRAGLAHASGVSVRVIGDLERGRRANYLETTLGAVEGALGWEVGTCQRIVAGGQPAHNHDAMMIRLLAIWPYLSNDARAMLVAGAERARELRE